MIEPPSAQGILYLTGANGRLAKALRPHLAREGPVIGVSRQPVGSDLSWDQFFSHISLKKNDAILHLAWSVLPLQAEQNPTASDELDLPLLNRMVEKIRREDSPWFGFFSTGAVYGEAGESVHTEESPPRPQGVYARKKEEAERLLFQAATENAFPLAILRLSNIYGFPYDPEKPQGIHAKLLHCAQNEQPFSLWGADTKKDYLHISDMQRGVTLFVRERVRGIWNLCQGHSTTITELLHLMERTTRQPIALTHHIPLPHMSWDITQVHLSGAKAGEIGFTPLTSMEAGIEQMMRPPVSTC